MRRWRASCACAAAMRCSSWKRNCARATAKLWTTALSYFVPGHFRFHVVRRVGKNNGESTFAKV